MAINTFSWARQDVVHLPAQIDEAITEGLTCLQTLVDESVVGEFPVLSVKTCIVYDDMCMLVHDVTYWRVIIILNYIHMYDACIYCLHTCSWFD